MVKEPDDFNEEFNEDFEEDLEVPEEEEAPKPKPKATKIASKTPLPAPIVKGKQINIYFMSTIGPGEKKQKLLVNTGNRVGDIKNTVSNLFGLSPEDFHLSYGGVTMEEENPLKEYDVADGDTVLLIPASTAGY